MLLDVIGYSMQLAMLRQLVKKGMLTDKEYNYIKALLQKNCKTQKNMLTEA